MNFGPGRTAVQAYRQQENFIGQIGRVRHSGSDVRWRRPGVVVSDIRESLRSPRRGFEPFQFQLRRRIDVDIRGVPRRRYDSRLYPPVHPRLHHRCYYRCSHRFHDGGLRRLVRRFILHEIRTGQNIPPEVTRLALNPLSLRKPVRFVEERLRQPNEGLAPDLVDEEIRQFLEDPFSTVNESGLRSERNNLESEVELLQDEKNNLLIDLGDLRGAIREALDELVQVRQMIGREENFNRPVLYGIAPVGRPTPRGAVASGPVRLQVIVQQQQQQAGPHGGMVDIFA